MAGNATNIKHFYRMAILIIHYTQVLYYSYISNNCNHEYRTHGNR